MYGVLGFIGSVFVVMLAIPAFGKGGCFAEWMVLMPEPLLQTAQFAVQLQENTRWQFHLFQVRHWSCLNSDIIKEHFIVEETTERKYCCKKSTKEISTGSTGLSRYWPLTMWSCTAILKKCQYLCNFIFKIRRFGGC